MHHADFRLKSMPNHVEPLHGSWKLKRYEIRIVDDRGVTTVSNLVRTVRLFGTDRSLFREGAFVNFGNFGTDTVRTVLTVGAPLVDELNLLEKQQHGE